MAISQFRSKRKVTGWKYAKRVKKLRHKGNLPSLTNLAPKHINLERTRGGHTKIKLFANDVANVFDPKTKKFEKLKIVTITENPANRHFVRRNIMTKGAIIKTDKGLAKITSRPGQEGAINAVLLDKK